MNVALTTVFVDRDGVINKKAPDGEYVNTVDDFELIEGSVEALAELSSRGVIIVVVTNQQGIAKGETPPQVVDEIHQRLRSLVAEAGGEISQIRVCPHREGTCNCRKPASGLFEQARQADPRIEFHESTVIGDSLSDIEAASRIGARAIFVGDGPVNSQCSNGAMSTVPDLAATLELLPWGRHE